MGGQCLRCLRIMIIAQLYGKLLTSLKFALKWFYSEIFSCIARAHNVVEGEAIKVNYKTILR